MAMFPDDICDHEWKCLSKDTRKWRKWPFADSPIGIMPHNPLSPLPPFVRSHSTFSFINDAGDQIRVKRTVAYKTVHYGPSVLRQVISELEDGWFMSTYEILFLVRGSTYLVERSSFGILARCTGTGGPKRCHGLDSFRTERSAKIHANKWRYLFEALMADVNPNGK